MNTEIFIEMLQINSTTGRERALADFLAERMAGEGRRVEKFEVESMRACCPEGYEVPVNLMVSWGCPKVVFCTHLDTVPPYIAPCIEETSSDVKISVHNATILESKGILYIYITIEFTADVAVVADDVSFDCS